MNTSNDWREVTLGEVMHIFTGRKNVNQTQPNGKYAFFSCSPNEIFWGDEYICDDDAIIITGNGAYTGSTRLFSGKFDLYQRTYGVVTKDEYKGMIDIIFTYFAVKFFFEKLYMGGTRGTSIPYIVLGDIKDFTISFPPLHEQKAIAEVLSSLDDKIDHLHRQNKTLEAVAQTLFRRWFIEDADESWAEKPLGKTVDISIGRTPPRKESKWFSKNPKHWKWISIKDMAKSEPYLFDTSEYLTQEAVEKFNIPVISANTVILSFKMTVGRVKIATENMLSNEAIAQFKFNSGTPYSKEYLYFFLKSFRFDSLGSTSTIVTSINTAMIKSIMIAIPNVESIERFGKSAVPCFNKIKFNQSQIRTLATLRDTLLPKLLSGKIKVKPS